MANALAGRLGRITKSRDVRAGLAGLVAIAVVTGALRAVQDEPNPTIAALLLLLAVLVTGTLSSLPISIVISITATLAFVYFLLPPYRSLERVRPAALAGALGVRGRSHCRQSTVRRREETDRRYVT